MAQSHSEEYCWENKEVNTYFLYIMWTEYTFSRFWKKTITMKDICSWLGTI